MKNYILLVMLFAAFTTCLFSREIYEHEIFINKLLSRIEATINPTLPDGISVGNSRLGSIKLDCAGDLRILRGSEVAARVVLMELPVTTSNPLPDDSVKTKFVIKTKRFNGEMTIGIVITGSDKNLVHNLTIIIDRLAGEAKDLEVISDLKVWEEQ